MLRASIASLFVSVSLVSFGCGRAALTPAPDASPAAPAPAAADAEPARTPQPALAGAASALAGHWSCRGAIHGPDGAPSPSEASLDVRLDLDQAWLRAELVTQSGAHKYDFTSYRTFHSSSGKWVNVILDNFGGHTLSWSDDGVIWTGESTSPMGALQIRDLETVEGSGELKMRGEYSLNGTSWRTGYDLACRK